MASRETVSVEQIEAEFKALLGEDKTAVDAQLGQQLTGQSNPVVALTPTAEEEVSQILALAQARDLKVVPLGLGSQSQMGYPGKPIDLVIRSAGMNQILEYSPSDMVVSVQPGVTLGQLQTTLAQNGQFLPMDPACPPAATVGGIVAAGSNGPLRTLYGGLRDMTIGLKAVYPDGRVVKTGGKVVKNVAGYDMTKLFIGSLGTLAFLSEIAFKLRPLPHHYELCLLSGEAAQVEQLSHRIVHSHLIPSRMEALSGAFAESLGIAHPFVCAVESHENQTAAAHQTHQLKQWGQELGMHVEVMQGTNVAAFWQQHQEHAANSSLVIRMALRPSAIAGVGQKLREHLRALGQPFHLSLGTTTGAGRVFAGPLTLSQEQQLVARCRELCAKEGGTAVVERGSLALRDKVDPFGPMGPELALMKGIKATIDPNGLMSPGRFVGGV